MPHLPHDSRRARPRRRRLAAPALLLCAALACAAPAFAQLARLTHADVAAKLIRKTTVYDVPVGTALLSGDLVSSSTGNVQLEWPGGVLVALGPDSSILVDNAATAPALTLLRGWIKVKAGGSGPDGKLALVAGPLVIGTAGSGILHVGPDRAELFVEQGTMAVSASDPAQRATPLVVGREQYAARVAGQDVQTAPRAPRPFVGALPRGFFDPLVGVAARVAPAAPVALREVDPADVAAWSDVPAPLRAQLAARFAPRLADPVFRAGALKLLGSRPEWQATLQSDTAPRKPQTTFSNHLF